MSRTILTLLLFPCVLCARTEPCFAWEEAEHRSLSGSCLLQVVTECGFGCDPDMILWQEMSFADLCAWMARKDRKLSRFQQRGQTVMQQMAVLNQEHIEKILREHVGWPDTTKTDSQPWPPITSAELSSRNVLCNYLVHHLIALHYGARAGRAAKYRDEAWRRALIYEAMAQGYLADAYSSCHLLPPDRNVFSLLHPFNTRQVHDHYRNFGIYVIDSLGHVWQTYGDGLLYWYGPTLKQVRSACLASLRELLFVYYHTDPTSPLPAALQGWFAEQTTMENIADPVQKWLQVRDGADYYSLIKMPTLLRLPMVVTATWSERLAKTDEHGIHLRKHYPQLREEGLHDPDLHGIDREFLYSRSDVPDWLEFSRLKEESPAELIRYSSDVASVRYTQNRRKAPSYFGGLLMVGGGYLGHTSPLEGTATFGVGFGLVDEIIEFRKLPDIRRISLEVSYQPTVGLDMRKVISPYLAFQIHIPRKLSLHIETGYAYGLEAPHKEAGARAAFGISSSTLPLGFIYIGSTVRLKYQVMYLEKIIKGVMVEFVFH